jgi:tRNA threonylcarbamoyladenosine biosynthesis protein TsaB
MLLLAIDTSGLQGSVALQGDERLIAEHELQLDRKASTTLLPAIDELFKQANFKRQDLQALAVSLGPGSFTGIRIGMATAQGIAQALDLPVYGVPSLLALAYPAREEAERIGVVRPARAGEIYFAAYRGRRDWGQIDIAEGRVTHEQLIKELNSGTVKLLLEEEAATEKLAGRLPTTLSRVPVHMSAASLAAAALHTPGIEISPGGLDLKPRMYSPGAFTPPS